MAEEPVEWKLMVTCLRTCADSVKSVIELSDSRATLFAFPLSPRIKPLASCIRLIDDTFPCVLGCLTTPAMSQIPCI
jgi:hypothetical protein